MKNEVPDAWIEYHPIMDEPDSNCCPDCHESKDECFCEEDFPVPVLDEPSPPAEKLVATGEARESNLDNPAMAVAAEQDSRGGENSFTAREFRDQIKSQLFQQHNTNKKETSK